MKRLAWHFAPANGFLAHTGEPIPADGVTLKIDGVIIPCEHGFHASERVIDALGFVVQDSFITRVELSGTIIEHGDPVDKLVASERTILWRLDAPTTDRILREWARWSALQVAHLWEMPLGVREYLETGDENLREAAENAAWDADRDATRSATARNAAWATAWAAARAAAWHSAENAVRNAARNAARNATRVAQNEKLADLIMAARQEALHG